jgi:hypothetical protein
MNMNRKSNRALSSLHTIAAAQSPVVRHLLDSVIRRAARGERDAVDQLAREFHPQMLAHAEEHMARIGGAQGPPSLILLASQAERRAPWFPGRGCFRT